MVAKSPRPCYHKSPLVWREERGMTRRPLTRYCMPTVPPSRAQAVHGEYLGTGGSEAVTRTSTSTRRVKESSRPAAASAISSRHNQKAARLLHIVRVRSQLGNGPGSTEIQDSGGQGSGICMQWLSCRATSVYPTGHATAGNTKNRH